MWRISATSVSGSHLKEDGTSRHVVVVKHAVVASFCVSHSDKTSASKIDGQVNLCGNVSGFIVALLERNQLFLETSKPLSRIKLN